MDNKEKKHAGRPSKKAPVSRRPHKQDEKQPGDEIEELFSVHVISDEDIENDFGTSEGGSDDQSKNEQ